MLSASKASKAFTLAELLIALAILGIIAAFTIPKILAGQNYAQKSAIIKEAATIFSEAYQLYKLEVGADASTLPSDFTQYINYAYEVTDSSLEVDMANNDNPEACNATRPCLKLVNGATLKYDRTQFFGGTGTTAAIWMEVDPDGVYSEERAVRFFLYYNGRITTWADILPGTLVGGVLGFNPDPTKQPEWFTWE